VTITAPASKYIAEAERLEAYLDKLIAKRNALEPGARFKRDHATLSHGIETAQADAKKYRTIAAELSKEVLY
jgi:chromosomal replication initiation ATPase DnaA